MKSASSPQRFSGRRGSLILLLGCLALILFCPVPGEWTFFRSWLWANGKVLFSNDAPLGVFKTATFQMPGALFGIWTDLNWLGFNAGALSPNLSSAFLLVLGPHGYANFYAPLSLLLLGMSAGIFFSQLGFQRRVCVLGGIAAALNMNYYSNACWGLASRALTLAAVFLALAALAPRPGRSYWSRTLLAGLAVGFAVMDGLDNGAIFSLYVSAFALFAAVLEEGPLGAKLSKSVTRIALMAVFSGLVAAQTVTSIVSTQVQGATGLLDQDQRTKDQRFDWATQWSLPKAETFRVIIPGIFGYRLNASVEGTKGGDYWGAVGQQPGYMEHRQGYPRHSGSGEYAGVLVVLVALWAAARSCAKQQPVYSANERRFIWFWVVVAIGSLLLAWGRHAPFYRWFYELPYFSTIRNPMKFMHPFHMAVIVLFGYGLEGLSRRYLDSAPLGGSLAYQLKRWWASLAGFDRRWAFGCVAVVGVSVLGWFVYQAMHPALFKYLARAGFNEQQAANIGQFGLGEIAMYLFFLTGAVLWLFCVLSGSFAGNRARWAAVIAGIFLVVDMSRANKHWIVYYNLAEKYATNPVVDILRVKPHEQRVSLLAVGGQPQYDMFKQFYYVEWAQHHFPYYGIQSVEIIQMPRVPEDYGTYLKAVSPAPARYWQLTNTRWFLGPAEAAPFLNQTFDPVLKRFSPTLRFALTQDGKGLISATIATNGPFTLYAFDGVLPRAKLYASWEVNSDDPAVLKKLADPAFDPTATVIVAQSPVGAAPAENKTRNAGTVEFTSYTPKRIQLKAKAETRAVLLLNDKYDPNWKVRVDGKPATLLRCNQIMRGVALEPGEHTVEFTFLPFIKPLYLSLAAIAFGLLLLGYVAVKDYARNESETAAPSPVAPNVPPASAPRKK